MYFEICEWKVFFFLPIIILKAGNTFLFKYFEKCTWGWIPVVCLSVTCSLSQYLIASNNLSYGIYKTFRPPFKCVYISFLENCETEVIKRDYWFQREQPWKQRWKPQRDRHIFVLVSVGHGTRLWHLYPIPKWWIKHIVLGMEIMRFNNVKFHWCFWCFWGVHSLLQPSTE